MTNFIPIFPLGLVAYPGENLNLHIFEPRYKQLITECFAESRHFGIPAVINKKISEMGTLMQVAEINQVHDNGDLDIKTRGIRVFRVLEVINEVPEKLYSGAIVNYPEEPDEKGHRELMQRVVNSIRQLHKLLKVSKDFVKPDVELVSYDVAHHAGLSLEEEYELLNLPLEIQRQEYLKRHLSRVLPVVAEMEAMKEKIKLNGHFRNLDALNLDM